jgi:hypothetical protein
LVDRNLVESHFGANQTLVEHDFGRTELVESHFRANMTLVEHDFGQTGLWWNGIWKNSILE